MSRHRRSGPKAAMYVGASIIALVALLPIAFLVLNSLKSDGDILVNPFGLPADWRFENFPRAWSQGRYSTTMINSTIVVVGSIVGVLGVSIPAAYGLSRLRLAGTNWAIVALVVLSSVPIQLFLVPLFSQWTRWGLGNSLIGLILIYVGLLAPFQTLLLRAFMLGIPTALEDAARVDGAGTIGVLRHVDLPLVRPGLLTVALLTGLSAWSEYLVAVTFLHDADLQTAVTGLSQFATEHERAWGLTFAASVITTLPVLVVFLIFQRRFIEGLAHGSLR